MMDSTCICNILKTTVNYICDNGVTELCSAVKIILADMITDGLIRCL